MPTPLTVEAATSALNSSSARLESLDVFRGATIASMMLVNNPGRWDAVYPPLLHAEWHGWTFTDTVFPFFLWIVGVAMTLSVARRVERGDDRHRLLLHALRRAAILFALGLFLNAFPSFSWDRIRIPGVLQRIAVCYLMAAVIFLYTRWRGQLFFTGFFLTVYWVLMMWTPYPGGAPGTLLPESNFSQWVDSLLLKGHMWSKTKTWDPEGVVSTLPAIATCLFGVLAGHIIRNVKPLAERVVWLFVAGALLMQLGLILNWWMPINKNLWTTSYSVFMAGLASTSLAVWMWLVDALGWRRWTRPFAIYGMNAIAVFVLSGIIGDLLGTIRIGERPLQTVLYECLFAPLASPLNASLLYALAHVLFLYAVAWLLYRRGWFIKF
jgi:predicted acyltransferase